jgi:hypothetical protein
MAFFRVYYCWSLLKVGEVVACFTFRAGLSIESNSPRDVYDRQSVNRPELHRR